MNGIIDDKKYFWPKGGMKKGDQILISRSLGTGIIFSAFMNGEVKPYILDSVLKEMNKSQHDIVNYINQLTNLNPKTRIINACTDITGFGLLGHLSEMLNTTNIDQLKMKLGQIEFYVLYLVVLTPLLLLFLSIRLLKINFSVFLLILV